MEGEGGVGLLIFNDELMGRCELLRDMLPASMSKKCGPHRR